MEFPTMYSFGDRDEDFLTACDESGKASQILNSCKSVIGRDLEGLLDEGGL
jgi:hypothetical protein